MTFQQLQNRYECRLCGHREWINSDADECVRACDNCDETAAYRKL